MQERLFLNAIQDVEIRNLNSLSSLESRIAKSRICDGILRKAFTILQYCSI